jgi:hypothetical protein
MAGRTCLALTVLHVLAAFANAQLQQPFVYTTRGAIANRNDATGVLTPTSASPLAVLGFPAVLDVKGRFLFAAGNSGIHMYQVDSVTGSYTEVPGSPYASTNTNNPILLATEPTGAFLAVVNSGHFVYQSTAANEVHVYSVDLSTGYFHTKLAVRPSPLPALVLPIAFSVAPGSGQNEVGPVATFTPANLVFGTSTVGIAAPTQSLMLSSTGGQALSVNAIAITRLNPGDFTETDNCNAPTVLKPTNSCLATVNFTPTASGSRLAQCAVTDNALAAHSLFRLPARVWARLRRLRQ